jgi:prolipoprotein diacylglyceryl transferase
MDAVAVVTWDVDPVLLRAGSLSVRWYSLLFAAAFLGGYGLWRSQMRRRGLSEEAIAVFLPLGFVAAVVGARLGECLLYEPALYLAEPWRVLQLRRGGLASHGAAAGLVLALFLHARLYRYPFGDAMDGLSPSVALAAGLVRLGNLANGEIVGTEASAPWAFRFVRHDGGAVPRHPVQLYEAALAFGVLAVLLLVDRRLGDRRPRWLMAGLLLALLFGGRIVLETWKDSPALAGWLPLTRGQALSIPFLAAGVALTGAALAGRTTRARFPRSGTARRGRGT